LFSLLQPTAISFNRPRFVIWKKIILLHPQKERIFEPQFFPYLPKLFSNFSTALLRFSASSIGDLEILFTLTYQQPIKMSTGETKRNIEIKAKLTQKEFEEKVEIAKQLTGQSQPEILNQHDVFFKVPNGRLKLRYEVRWKR
jgi:hypothetical protein